MSATDVKQRRGSKAEVAYDSIRSKIVEGVYGPGYRLVLDRLATEIGVSAVPVREALRRLEAEGYVDFKRNVGATVVAIDAEAYVEAMEALAIVEAAATSLAAPYVTKANIKAARKLNQALAVSLEDLDPVSFSRHNRELHELLYLPCPNHYLLGLVEREWDRLRGIRHSGFAFVPEWARETVGEHNKLIDLIESGATATKIEDCARNHRLHTAKRFVERYSSDAESRR